MLNSFLVFSNVLYCTLLASVITADKGIYYFNSNNFGSMHTFTFSFAGNDAVGVVALLVTDI